MGNSQNSVPNLPPPKEGEKNVGVRKELENQHKAIREGFTRPGDPHWEVVQETIARLKALVARE